MRRHAASILISLVVAVLVSAWPTVAQAIHRRGGMTRALADSLYCAVAGCTMTGTTTYSGVTTDITTAGNEDLILDPGGGSGSGSTVIVSEDNTIEIREDDGTTVRGVIQPSTTFGLTVFRGGAAGSTDGQLQLCTSGTCSAGNVQVGARDAIVATATIFSITDTLGGTPVNLFTVYGDGLITAPNVTPCNCGTTGTPNTVTCEPTTPIVVLTDGDADSCTVTWATSTVADTIDKYIQHVVVVVDSVGGGGTFDLADQPGILELTGAYSMGVNDTLSLMYAAGSLDAWQETDRSNL